ncbi:MAG: hypothetical protein HPY76_12875 [Anaerolineae bacterium]|nr:hypothetical protein [Anaerolineae bacterium]
MSVRTKIMVSLIGGLLIGAVVSALSPGSFWLGWLLAGVLSALGCFALVSAWQWAGGGKFLAWMVILALLLRLGVGVSLSLLLPEHGYDTETQNAGYLFYDAYRRDLEAWDWAQSGASAWLSFTQEVAYDQYGGLLFISVLVYRYLSPDVHRPFLILLLGAFTTAAGIPFFLRALRGRFSERAARIATAILVFYPDAFYIGAAQMREPFLLGLSAIAFWGLMELKQNRRQALPALIASMVGMVIISSRIAVAVAGLMALWYWLETLWQRSKAWRVAGFVALGLGALAVAVTQWDWFSESARLDLFVTAMQSGRVQDALKNMGEAWRAPFMIVYGLAQPVLPAAIAEPTVPVWKVIAVARAAGWYALAPLILYGAFTAWFARDDKNRRVLGWLAALLLLWIVISSVRAGGDQWDNPRYRLAYLPWLALLAGWGVDRALAKRDLWLVRWLLVEAIFVGFFTNWYFSRYFRNWNRLPFWENVLWILGLSAIVLASGVLWDAIAGWLRRRRGRLQAPPGGQVN